MAARLVVGTIRGRRGERHDVVLPDGSVTQVIFDGEAQPAIGADVIGLFDPGAPGTKRLTLVNDVTRLIMSGRARIVTGGRPDVTARMYRPNRLIGLSQSIYIDKVLKRFSMENSKRGVTPMAKGTKLSKGDCPKTDEDRRKMANRPYANAIGSIMYAMVCTRPDVNFSLSMVSRFQSDPGEKHWNAVKNILKYLRRTKEMFIVYGGEEILRVEGYSDASYESDKKD